MSLYFIDECMFVYVLIWARLVNLIDSFICSQLGVSRTNMHIWTESRKKTAVDHLTFAPLVVNHQSVQESSNGNHKSTIKYDISF